MLRYIIFFSTLLMIAVTVRAQCDTPVVGGNRIMTEGLQQGPFPEGSTIKFKCSTGYVPERLASSSITCMGTQWSELELQCRKKSCGNPGEITNGKYEYQPTDAVLFGAVVTAVCNKGSKVLSNPGNSTLVSMQTKVPSTEEASSRSVPESIVLSHLVIEY
ncbi:hypothetical protein Q7C36_018983 [Tachysurus vachellii]|uniref:Sushi domain-containing protein n=1 Tax=Tachysurus vachellii TaxID=175792 RepID=A0AA88LVI0_TACVA|nr:hypothetical protein Q7C36_018983 [Tachysurus vachellii]